MNIAQIKAVQEKVGATPDGFWGPKSITACQKYLRSLMPSPNPWPKSDQGSLQKFYGSPGDESRHAVLNVKGLGVKYDGKPVSTIRCHERVAESLGRVITSLSKSNPEILAGYAGCYNNRLMRGGSSPSLHARAAAIDLCPGDNGNRVSWPSTATMPLEVMETFAREGWLSAGAFWGRDAMHFQATL
jgi:hypothetical protein